MSIRKILTLLTAFIAISATGLAHSVNLEHERHAPVVTVKAFFSRTSPMANALVFIHAPGETEPYQTGRSDNAGYFAFRPDVAGDWIYAVDDERGHAGRLIITIGEDFFYGKEEALPGTDPGKGTEEAPVHIHETYSEGGIPLAYRLIFGLAIILGVTGLLYGIKARKELQKNNVDN